MSTRAISKNLENIIKGAKIWGKINISLLRKADAQRLFSQNIGIEEFAYRIGLTHHYARELMERFSKQV